MNFRQRLAAALCILGCLGLTGAIVGVVNLVSTIQHQGAKIERQQSEIGTIVGTLQANVHAQVGNRTKNVIVWCRAINATRKSERQFNNLTLRQAQAEDHAIRKAVDRGGLPRNETRFLDTLIQSLADLEQKYPFVLRVHPLRLPDLPCKALATATRKSGQHHSGKPAK